MKRQKLGSAFPVKMTDLLVPKRRSQKRVERTIAELCDAGWMSLPEQDSTVVEFVVQLWDWVPEWEVFEPTDEDLLADPEAVCVPRGVLLSRGLSTLARMLYMEIAAMRGPALDCESLNDGKRCSDERA